MALVSVPVLSDGVVTLRAHTDDDVEAIVEQWHDPVSQAWTAIPVPYSRDDARRFVRDVMPGGWASDEEWGFAVEAESGGGVRYAGSVLLRNRGERRAEIAFAALPWARGTGAMEAALRLALRWVFTERAIATVGWFAYPGNWSSRRLMWKVGFSFDGVLRGWLDQRGELRDAWVGTICAGEPLEPRAPWLDVPRIEGHHVRLRMHRPDDLDRMHEGATDPRTVHWLGRIPDPYTREMAADFLLHRSDGMAAGTDLHWMLADPVSDALLGTVSLMHLAEGMAEVGYWAHPEARGRGVMTEAVRLACRHAFIDPDDGGLGLHRLYATVAVDNLASRHVLERAGFTLTGTEHRSVIVRDGMHDGAAYELLRTR
jgi:RimJ/RimL family protein N-acetyltransferase